MILRPYQTRFVEKMNAALKEKGNSLGIAATGAGKTIMLAAVTKRVRKKGKALILQHRDELVDQNLRKFLKVNPGERCSLFTADVKSWHGDTVFAMQQTLARNLDRIPKFDVCVIDEAHHIAAPTYARIIEAVRTINPDCKLAGFTATPERGDKTSLRRWFDNVADKVTIRELVSLGFLVPPRAFVISVGSSREDLQALGRVTGFEQDKVAAVLNNVAVTSEVLRNWKEKAHDRPTVVFCATVQHAQDMAAAYREAGVAAACVHGDMPDWEREHVLKDFDKGKLQVITNCMVLTEGWDCQPVSCVVLLRQCSEKGPLIQMAGRGLRTVDPEIYPGVRKSDCVILDFGTSILTHGNLDQDDGLHEESEKTPGEAQTKTCPLDGDCDYIFPDRNGKTGCGAELPVQTRTCPICGFLFERSDGQESEITEVDLTEMDILNASPFRWVDLFGSGKVMIATGFAAWVGIFSADGDTFHALGKQNGSYILHKLAFTDRLHAMVAADDFLREHETDSAARKSKRWLNDGASDKQIEILNRFGYGITPDMLGNSCFTKYTASCHATFQFNRRVIEGALGVS